MTDVIFEYVTPAEVSSFYAVALPRAGYKITTNSVFSESGSTDAVIQFTGHGFKGNIDTLANYPSTGVSIAGLGHKDVSTISLLPS
ncbi:MAG: hypothetical protein ACRDOB_00835 [Streptosporangiaceae bacterium]